MNRKHLRHIHRALFPTSQLIRYVQRHQPIFTTTVIPAVISTFCPVISRRACLSRRTACQYRPRESKFGDCISEWLRIINVITPGLSIGQSIASARDVIARRDFGACANRRYIGRRGGTEQISHPISSAPFGDVPRRAAANAPRQNSARP